MKLLTEALEDPPALFSESDESFAREAESVRFLLDRVPDALRSADHHADTVPTALLDARHAAWQILAMQALGAQEPMC